MIEVLKQALEALDNLMYWDNGKPEYDEARKAIKSLRQAIAELESQEPIGYLSEGGAERLVAKKQAHEQIKNFRLFAHDVPVYTQPPQRTWVDLTDTQIEKVYFKVVAEHRGAPMPWGQVQFGKAVLEKFKEKNNA